MLTLDEKYITMIQAILQKYIPNQTIWVYGSRIKGTAHEGSDLDLVIAPSTRPITAQKLAALKSAFSDSNLPILIDIMDWETIPDQFKSEIEKEHLIFPTGITL